MKKMLGAFFFIIISEEALLSFFWLRSNITIYGYCDFRLKSFYLRTNINSANQVEALKGITYRCFFRRIVNSLFEKSKKYDEYIN
jgi:hypothetical protein